MSKFLDRPIFRTLKGENKAGRILFAILDILPIPNVHEVIKAVLSKDNPVNVKELASGVWNRIDGLRTTFALLVTSALIWLTWSGAMTPEELAGILKTIIESVF
jgi:predicted transcriptional regulator with HTH domain